MAERPSSQQQEPPSMLPEGGVNLFQEIKAVCEMAEARGKELIKLSIGEPDGWPFDSAIEAAQMALGTRS